MNAVILSFPSACGVWANTVKTSAFPPLEIQTAAQGKREQADTISRDDSRAGAKTQN
jgi:hypothetical protein